MQQTWMCSSLEDAVLRLLAAAPCPLQAETVSLEDALGRVLAEDVYASFDQPPFDRSPLDGYAVRAADTVSAGRESPAVLRVAGETLAGMPPAPALRPGEAVRIMTGAPIPPGADCAVRQEDTDYGEGRVQVYVSHRPFQNYCRRGEDLREGTLALRREYRLDAAAIGILAMLGRAEVRVLARPKVALLTAGDELTEPGRPLPDGKIYNSNQYLLSARLLELGALPQIQPCRGDDVKCLGDTVDSALREVPFLITTGGVSVGKRDLMPEVCRSLNGELLFHGVPVKPGAPAMAFRHRGGLALCLSGNPFAAAATFELLARPVLQKMQGLSDRPLPRTTAVLQEPFPKASPGRRLLRARFRDGRVCLPRGGADVHASGVLSSLLDCNCLIDIPAGSAPLTAGQTVSAVLLEPGKEGDPAKMSAAHPGGGADLAVRGQKAIPVIAVSGVKNSGKTTFLEKLIPLLRKRGYRVAVIKHDGHDFAPDVPGTDSFRLSAAGAEGVSVFSGHRFMTVQKTEEASVESLLQLFGDMDLILLEGLKDSSYPKLEIVRGAVSKRSVCPTETLLAVVTDTDITVEGVPSLPLNDAGSAASLIGRYMESGVIVHEIQ